MRTTRSLTSRASSWSWVTNTLVTRISSCSRRSQRRSSWFVGQQHLGFGGEGAGQGHALALSARELRRIAVLQVLLANKVSAWF
jgi:hypothetical protein